MAKLFRKTEEKVDIPPLFEVLWGDDLPGGRSVIDSGENLSGRGGKWAQTGSNNLYEWAKVKNSEWLLVKYNRMNRLSARNYLEITRGTARLLNGVIAHHDPELIEE